MEIGARGFVAGTLYQFLSQIGIKGHNRAKYRRCFIEIMEIVSCGYVTKEISCGTIQNKVS